MSEPEKQSAGDGSDSTDLFCDEWWFPTRVDDKYFARLREDYPEDTEGKSDEELHDYYCEGQKYATTWDHTGDAYEQFEKLADAFLELLSKQNGGDHLQDPEER